MKSAAKILLVALLLAPAGAASQTFVTVPLASYHTHRNGYNELNLGLGFEHQVAPRWRISAGFYRNSNRRDSVYAGALHLPWKLGPVRLGTSLGIVTGYGRHDVIPMAAPTVVLERDGWGLNLLVVPPVDGKALLALQAKFALP